MKTSKQNMAIEQILFILLLPILVGFWGCSSRNGKTSLNEENLEEQLRDHPEWTKSANIYEVNIRQYTPEGTLKAFQEHLPRLKKMGVDIIWLMPVHPIGEKNRKGKLGSYYSIKDYKSINPSFGNKQDLVDLVNAAHEQDMHLIMDLVPNHTAWDHPWITEHPEYYAKDSLGNITYEADWTDIARLDYVNNRQVWDAMIDVMKYWIEEADIDGYRVDHAGHDIPVAFWKKAIPEVDKVKEGLFWLAEWNTANMHPWFDATYTWDYFHTTTDVASGEKALSSISEYKMAQDTLYPESAYRLYFTTNHDENSWNGTDKELFGKNYENFAVMAATIDGMPLVYGGQETGLDQRLEFFRKDTIQWDGLDYADLYRTLFELKDENEALWNGQYGGEFKKLDTNNPKTVYAYKRVKGDNEVLVILNFSDENKTIEFKDLEEQKTYTNVFEPEENIQIPNKNLLLAAHRFLVLQIQE